MKKLMILGVLSLVFLLSGCVLGEGWIADDLGKKITITFDVNGGTLLDPLVVDENTVISNPTNPEKAKFTFGGWYKDEELTEEFDFGTVIDADLTLYAKWIPIVESVDIKVTFETNGGTEIEEVTIKSNTAVDEPIGPVKTGFNFDGWYKDEELTEEFDFEDLLQEDTIIYVKWVPIQIIVDKEPYKIGYLGPFSGEHVVAGFDTNWGIKLAIDKINEMGGINGHPLELYIYDIGSDFSNLNDGYDHVVNMHNVMAIIVTNEDNDIGSLQSMASADGIALITTSINEEEDEEFNSPTFHVSASDELRMRLSVNNVLKNLGAEHPGFIYSDVWDDWDTVRRPALVSMILDAGFQFYEIRAAEDFTDPDWKHTAFDSWKFRQVDMVISVGSAVYLNDIQREMLERDLDWDFFNLDIWNYDQMNLDNGYYLEEFSIASDDGYVQSFITDYNLEYDKTPTNYAALGYDAMFILYKAMMNAEEVNRINIINEIPDVELDNSVTGFLGFDEHGNANKEMLLIEKNDGVETVSETIKEE